MQDYRILNSDSQMHCLMLQIINGLQNLSPAERDRFERALAQEMGGGGAGSGGGDARGQAGMSSTGPPRR